MANSQQNKHIARLIVGAMNLDGQLSKKEREKVVKTLTEMGMQEMIADFGAAFDDDLGALNVFQECQDLVSSLGSSIGQAAPLIFRLISEVVASDRFVSSNEAAYLSGIAKRLGLSAENSRGILKEVMAKRRGRLEVSAEGVNAHINPYLKELLSFEGSQDLVGEVESDSLEEMAFQAKQAMAEGANVSFDEMERSLAILGLGSNAKLKDAETVWRETIDGLNLPKMADLGETFVTAAINRISTINEAYKTILKFHQSLTSGKS
jgi:hypothetical protein